MILKETKDERPSLLCMKVPDDACAVAYDRCSELTVICKIRSEIHWAIAPPEPSFFPPPFLEKVSHFGLLQNAPEVGVFFFFLIFFFAFLKKLSWISVQNTRGVGDLFYLRDNVSSATGALTGDIGCPLFTLSSWPSPSPQTSYSSFFLHRGFLHTDFSPHKSRTKTA